MTACPVCGAASGARSLAPSVPTSHDSYDRFADKVGLVPNLRVKDNALQAVFVAVTTVLGAGAVGVLGGWPMGVLGGAVLGLVGGGLVSGTVLMIRGLRRR